MKTRTILLHGFTLVELMITLAVAVVALSIAVPSFQSAFQANRLTTQANALVTAINLARSEAIKRGVSTTLRAGGSSFEDGWCVHLGASCAGTDILRQFEAMNQISVDSGGVTVVTFDARGSKSVPNGVVNIDLQPDGCSAGTADRLRTINIANTGRASVTAGNCT
ncbi:GspH/FimT family pseudopilin [Sedimenticola hydrogenitrophicus]|uniref:GspH/FimT family pseudopilin n=1 Tax=Sedimenticola hydrogenitrophicus TaxID=2967975 RepID=UPI0023B1D0C6|nr:GspH/FimT family pseudopilin [Sedimenticola hydrogenitrophicus]